MRTRITLGKYLVYCLLVSLIALIIVDASMGYMAFQMDFKVILAITVGVNLFSYVIYSFPIVGYSICGLIPVSLLVYFLIWKDSFLKTAKYLWELANGCAVWLYEYVMRTASLDELYMRITVIVFIVLLTILLFFLLIVKRWILVAMTAGVVYLAAMRYFGYNEAFGYLQKFIFTSFALYGLINFDRLETGWRLKQYKYSKNIIIVWTVCILVSLGLIYITTEFLPNKIEAVNVQWLNDNVFSKIPGYFSRGGTNSRFSIGTVGFQSGSTKLGGSVKMSDRQLFRARVDGKIGSPIYLRGSIKNEYTGTMWSKTDADEKGVSSSEGIPGLLGNDILASDTNQVTVTIYSGPFSTSTLFGVWRPYKVNADGRSFNIYDDGEIYFDGSSPSEYKVISKVPSIYSDELKKTDFSYNRNELNKYLQLPQLPDRVLSLTHNLTDRYGNPYDKAVAIQNYLRETYPYTLETSDVPDGRDFVDYFLFDEKQGYCTYYASAMAVMCRIAGIPSRYVEGFVLNPGDKGVDGIYNVNASRAHAWVELYFDGYGWVNFEPTSAYSVPDFERPADVPADTPAYNPEDNTQKGDITPGRNGHEVEMDDEAGGINQKPTLPWQTYAGIVLAAVILIRIITKRFIEWQRIKRADSLKDKEAAMEYYKIIENRLKLGGINRNTAETPAEFGQRVYQHMIDFGVDLRDIVDIFNTIRFGNLSIDDASRKKFKLAVKAAGRVMKARMGVIKYTAVKYLF